MADPEIPEVRAEIQREDRPAADPRYDRRPASIGGHLWLWAAFAAAIVVVVVVALNV